MRHRIERMSRRVAAALAVSAAVVAAAVLVPLLASGSSGKPRLSRDAYARGVTAVFVNLSRQFHAASAGAGPAETSASLASIKAALDRATARNNLFQSPETFAAGSSRITVDLNAGVLLVSAVASSGTRTFASG